MPSYNFLAISKTIELYTTYDQFHYSACKSAQNFLLSPEINHLHPRSTRLICEIQLLQDPVKVPKNCEIRQIQINTIFTITFNYFSQTRVPKRLVLRIKWRDNFRYL